MISFLQAIILGAVQGITELFPISSLGHSVLLPGLFSRIGFTGWDFNQNADVFLTFLVATHFATAIVLFCIYGRDWMRIIRGIFRSIAERDIPSAHVAAVDGDAAYARLGWLLIVATIPAGIVGVLFQKQVAGFFVAPAFAAFFLLLNSVLLFGTEMLRRKTAAGTIAERVDSISSSDVALDADRRIASQLSWGQSVKVGCMQILALIPGFSRTGSTLSGSLLVGLSHEDSLRFSFLLATPIIAAAALLELPPLVAGALANGATQPLAVAFVGALVAAVAAYFSATFLARYFHRHATSKTLIPFALYCAIVGAISFVLLR